MMMHHFAVIACFAAALFSVSIGITTSANHYGSGQFRRLANSTNSTTSAKFCEITGTGSSAKLVANTAKAMCIGSPLLAAYGSQDAAAGAFATNTATSTTTGALMTGFPVSIKYKSSTTAYASLTAGPLGKFALQCKVACGSATVMNMACTVCKQHATAVAESDCASTTAPSSATATASVGMPKANSTVTVSFTEGACPCDFATAPTYGKKGDCTATVAAGKHCTPTCDTGYKASGMSMCSSAGVKTAATCKKKTLADEQADVVAAKAELVTATASKDAAKIKAAQAALETANAAVAKNPLALKSMAAGTSTATAVAAVVLAAMSATLL